MASTTEEETRKCLYHLGKYFTEYSTSAQIHGIKYISRRTAAERLLWGIITLCFVLICMAQILKLYAKLNRFPVVLGYETEEKQAFEVPFPSVTICPETKAIQSQFSYAQSKKAFDAGNLPEDKRKTFEYLYFICDQEESSKQTFQTNYFTNDFYETVQKLSPNLSDVIETCKWNHDQLDCSKFFTTIFIDEGICYSFNLLDKIHIFRNTTYLPKNFFESYNKESDWNIESGYASLELLKYPFRVLFSGSDRALELYLKANPADFDSVCKSSFQGFKVFVCNPSEIPQSPHNYFRVSPYDHTVATILPKLTYASSSLIKFSAHKRKCYMSEEKMLKYFTNYSQPACLQECTSNYTFSKCGCVAHYMPKTQGLKICGGTNYNCVQEAINEITVEAMKLASNESAESICDCLPSCTILKYHTEVSTNAVENLTDPNSAQAVLTIYLNSNDFLKLQRYEAFTVLELLANIGGLIGLYIGGSVMTVIEFFYFWTVRMYCNKLIYGRWTGRKLIRF